MTFCLYAMQGEGSDAASSMSANEVQTYSNCCWIGSLKRIL
jgi:hypothetical protein